MAEKMAPVDHRSMQKRPRAESMKLGSDQLRHLSSIITDMNQAVTKEQRMIAIQNAKRAFNHDVPELHNVEVESGLIHALCVQLGYVLNKQSGKHFSDIEGLCSILQLVYCCKDSVRESSFHDIGKEVLPLLLRSLESCNHAAEENEWCDSLVLNISKILRAFSRAHSVSLIMVQSRDLLKSLLTLINGERSTQTKIEALSTMKNITFYAEEYRSMILDLSGFLDCLLHVCLYDSDGECRECASAMLRNIAFDNDAKIKMAQNGKLLNVVLKISSDPSSKTKRNAVSIIASLTMLNENNFSFVNHSEGAIVDMLSGLIRIDDDSAIRKRAARALRCLCDDETVEFLINRIGLMITLTNAATNDSCQDVRAEAVKTLATYSIKQPACLGGSMKLVDLMVDLSKNTNPSCAQIIAEALMKKAAFPANRTLMIERDGLIEALTRISYANTSTVAAREFSCCALNDLSCEAKNRQKMTCTSVLTSMVKIASFNDDASLIAQEYAVKVILNLSAEANNRKRMASQKGLLSVLVQRAASSNGNPTKDDVKQAVINLVSAL